MACSSTLRFVADLAVDADWQPRRPLASIRGRSPTTVCTYGIERRIQGASHGDGRSDLRVAIDDIRSGRTDMGAVTGPGCALR